VFIFFGTASDISRNPDQKKRITSFDVDCQDRMVCAGTEALYGDVYTLFWDVRAAKMLGAYWYSHSDDITQVRVRPPPLLKSS
jgi:hypothetical protein